MPFKISTFSFFWGGGYARDGKFYKEKSIDNRSCIFSGQIVNNRPYKRMNKWEKKNSQNIK